MLAVFLIPTARNPEDGGQLFAASEYSAWEADLIDLFGGWTKVGGAAADTVKGAWLDKSGRLYLDVHNAYLVYVADISHTPVLALAADIAKARFAQKSVTVIVNGDMHLL